MQSKLKHWAMITVERWMKGIASSKAGTENEPEPEPRPQIALSDRKTSSEIGTISERQSPFVIAARKFRTAVALRLKILPEKLEMSESIAERIDDLAYFYPNDIWQVLYRKAICIQEGINQRTLQRRRRAVFLLSAVFVAWRAMSWIALSFARDLSQLCLVALVLLSGYLCWMLAFPGTVWIPQRPDYFLARHERAALVRNSAMQNFGKNCRNSASQNFGKNCRNSASQNFGKNCRNSA
ncbi:MAG: hypothetical protein ACYCOU_04680, partial [Sulfobacillus sp.]